MYLTCVSSKLCEFIYIDEYHCKIVQHQHEGERLQKCNWKIVKIDDCEKYLEIIMPPYADVAPWCYT